LDKKLQAIVAKYPFLQDKVEIFKKELAKVYDNLSESLSGSLDTKEDIENIFTSTMVRMAEVGMEFMSYLVAFTSLTNTLKRVDVLKDDFLITDEKTLIILDHFCEDYKTQLKLLKIQFPTYA